MPEVQEASANLLIQSMEGSDYLALSPHFERVGMTRGQVVSEAGEIPKDIVFPEGGVYSVLSGLGEPIATEIGLFGREGLSNLSYILGSEPAPYRTIIQIDGHTALRIAADRFAARLEESAGLRSLIFRFAHTHLVQVSQSLVSALHHHLESRLARWLLMCSDRINEDEMHLTHDFMSNMLGVQRTSVTVTLHVLEGIGAIRSTRGLVLIRDRAKLEELAGHTYGFAEAEYSRLIAPFGSHALDREGVSHSIALVN